MIIKVENLHFTYMKGSPLQKEALKNINLTIKKGEFTGIIGHTGSGKSTLVQHFNGLLKPTSGKVIVDGMDSAQRNIKEVREKVGIIFQYPEHQLFDETVYRDITFGMRQMNFSKERIDKNLKWALETVGLEENILEKSPFELSGGQKRRVAIAGVIVMEPQILILDEPAAGLDPKGCSEIYGYVKRLHEDKGITVILVSHNMEDIARLCERIIVMNEGMIEMDGKPADIFSNAERLQEIGLSIPQAACLLKKIKDVFPEVNADIYSVAGARDEIVRLLKAKEYKG